jgi:TRAP-type mannitol/chloroaromatic compound transport system substrate-binding protein
MKRRDFLKKAGVGTAVVAATAVNAPFVHAAKKTTTKWRMQTIYSQGSTVYKLPVAFCEDVKKRTNGRLVIQPFASGALMPSKEVFPAVKRGTIPIGMSSPAYVRSQIPLANVCFGLPFTLQAPWEVTYFHMWLGFEQMMIDACAKHGVYFASSHPSSNEFALKVPVTKMEDFKGMKLRSSGGIQLFLNKLGAAASYIPGEEIYTSLATGLIQGAHWGAARSNNDMGFYELCKYHLDLPLSISVADNYWVNEKAMAKLDPDLQIHLKAALRERWMWNLTQYQYQEEIKRALIGPKYGVKFIKFSPKEYSRIQAKAFEFWEEVAAISPETAKVVQMYKDFNKSLGR